MSVNARHALALQVLHIHNPSALTDEEFNSIAAGVTIKWSIDPANETVLTERSWKRLNSHRQEQGLQLVNGRLGRGWFARREPTTLQVTYAGRQPPTVLGPPGTGLRPVGCIWTGSTFSDQIDSTSSWTNLRDQLAGTSHRYTYRCSVPATRDLLIIDSEREWRALIDRFSDEEIRSSSATITAQSIDWMSVAKRWNGIHVTTRAIIDASSESKSWSLLSWTTESTAWFTGDSLELITTAMTG